MRWIVAVMLLVWLGRVWTVPHVLACGPQTSKDTEPVVAEAPPEALDGAIPIKEIGEATLAPVKGKIDYLVTAGAKTITLRITSRGGVVEDGVDFVQYMDEIKKQHVKFRCIVDGRAMSMAIYVLQGCDERLATKRSVFLAHEPWTHAVGNAHDLEKTTRSLAAHAEIMAQFIGRRLTIGVDGYRKKVAEGDWIFNYDEALRIQAIDGVIEPEQIPYVYSLPATGTPQLMSR